MAIATVKSRLCRAEKHGRHQETMLLVRDTFLTISNWREGRGPRAKQPALSLQAIYLGVLDVPQPPSKPKYMVHIRGRQDAYNAVSVHEDDKMILLEPGEVEIDTLHKIRTFYGQTQPDTIPSATVIRNLSTTRTLTRQWLL
jgi:hypothetical protein